MWFIPVIIATWLAVWTPRQAEAPPLTPEGEQQANIARRYGFKPNDEWWIEHGQLCYPDGQAVTCITIQEGY